MGKQNKHDMPFAAMGRGSHIELYSNKEAVIEGIKGVVEYTDVYIKLSLFNGIVEFFGDSLEISALNLGAVIINGKILKIEFGEQGEFA